MADLFERFVPGDAKPKRQKPPPPPFYEVLEGFIEKHEGTDRVSQEFEHLATRLRHADPEYVAVIAALPKTTVKLVFEFAYRMLQQKD